VFQRGRSRRRSEPQSLVLGKPPPSDRMIIGALLDAHDLEVARLDFLARRGGFASLGISGGREPRRAVVCQGSPGTVDDQTPTFWGRLNTNPRAMKNISTANPTMTTRTR